MPNGPLPEPLADYAERLLAGTGITPEQAHTLAATRDGDYPPGHPAVALRAGWHASTDDLPLTLTDDPRTGEPA